LEFDVIPSKIDENISEKLQPNEYVMKLSRLKAENVSSMLGGDEIVIGADTTVYLDGIICINQRIATRLLKY
jgi:predicted house-cleaning NTP pyrophosphatase (Maf/HAM1 superfamily)